MHTIDDILNQLRQGKRCVCGFEDEEFSTTVSLEQDSDGTYAYQAITSHKYDVVGPARYDKRTVNEQELRTLLRELPEDAFDRVSYVYKDMINETTRNQVELIYSSLKQHPKTVYVVFNEDRWKRDEYGNPAMNFSGLYPTVEQAEHMVDYLRTKQGATSHWREITLTFNGQEIKLGGGLSPSEQVTSKQILATLLAMERDQIARFFEG